MRHRNPSVREIAAIAVAAVLLAFLTLSAVGEAGDGMTAKANDSAAGGSGSLDALRDQFVLASRGQDE